MAQLWMKDRQSAPGAWVAVPLTGASLALNGVSLSPRAAPAADGEATPIPSVRLLAIEEAEGQPHQWALLADRGAELHVNGLRLPAALAVLRDRDQIRAVDGATVFFSTETLPVMEPFAGADHAVICPRCKQPISKGDPAVRCPGCGIWHHQSEEKPCWLGYVADGEGFNSCALCDYSVALFPDADFRWTPEEL